MSGWGLAVPGGIGVVAAAVAAWCRWVEPWLFRPRATAAWRQPRRHTAPPPPPPPPVEDEVVPPVMLPPGEAGHLEAARALHRATSMYLAACEARYEAERRGLR